MGVIGLVILCSIIEGCSGYSTLEKPSVQSTALIMRKRSPDYQWVKGHFVFEEGRYKHVRGKYVYSPRYRTVWAPAHHRKTKRGKVWIDDRWK
jgi:hypothetical protein